MEDSGKQLQDGPHLGGYAGVILEERVSGPFYIGAGITNYTLSEYYDFSLPSGYLSGGSSGKSLFGIPVSLAWYHTNKKWAARLAGALGYMLPFMKNSSTAGHKYTEGTTLFQNGDTFNYKAHMEIQSSTLYLGVDFSGSYSLSSRFAIHSFLGYSYGFKSFFQSKLIYQYNSEPQQGAKINFGLNHLNCGLGLRYALSKH